MVDISDPVVWATVAQTVVLTLTLVIFILSFRSQDKAIKEAAYQKALDDYTDAMKMLVDKPELHKLQLELMRANRPPGSEREDPSTEEKTIRNYIMLLYGLFERVHLLYRRKWIDKEPWTQWSACWRSWLGTQRLGGVHRSAEGMYDKPFQDYVSSILNRKA